MTTDSNRSVKFEEFIIDLIPESPRTPMIMMIATQMGLAIELPSTGAFHHHPFDDGGTNVVMFKMDNATSTPAEISFLLSDTELAKLKEVSLLPVIG